MKNNTRLIYILTIGILITSFSIAYYFIIFLPSQFQQEDLINQQTKQNSQNDSLNLFGEPNQKLDDCLIKVNPSDPLGIFAETEAQRVKREECINKYKK